MDRYSPNIQRQLNQYLQGNLGSRTPGGDYGDPSSGGFGMQSGLLGGAYENLSIGMPNTGRSGEGARNFRQNLASGGQHNDDVHLDMYGSGIQMEGVPGVMSNEGGQSDIQELIREETVKAQHCTDTLSVGKSMNTIIILDSSNHMNRTQFAHAKETIECFLQGLETNSMEYSLEENVALVTFGPESTVLQHLTNDYQKIRLVLENLECGGRSSLTYAFLLIYAVMERCYQTHVPEHQFPRILLISNGQIPGINQDELQYLQAVLIEKLQIKVFFVPLGETNEAFSRVIQAVNGEMILAGNIEFFSRSHIHHNIASVIRGQSSGGNITRENIRITSDAQFQARQINDTDIDAILKLLRGESPSAQGGVFLAFGGENDDVQLFGQHGHNQQFGGQRGVNQQFGGQSGNLDHLGRQSGLSHQFGGQRGVNQQFSGQSDMLDEFGGQSGFNHMFDGQRGVNHQFGGQSGLNDMFDGERGVNHQFGGQRSVIQQFGGQSGVTRQFDVQSDLNHQLGRQSGEVQHYGEQRSDVQVLQSDMQHLSVEGQFNTPPVTHQQTFPPTEGEEGLNGGPSVVSSRTTTQTTSSSQLQQPIQPDPSRQSPITIAALRQQQQQQDNLPTRSPNSNTPLVPTEQQWNTQVTTSSNTRQTSASEAIYTKNTQNVICLNGGPSAVSSRTTTQTTSSSQLQQPIQPDPSRQSPITIAALRQQEQQQQQQDNLPTRSPNSNTPLVPTEQQWNTQVTTSSNTRQTSASEAIYTKNTQNVICLNGGPSAVSSRTTTQTTSSSQLQQPIQPDPSRQSPITIAALRQQEQQQQQQDNLPTRSPNSNTPLVPTEQQWNTQVTTSSNTRQTSASEAIYTKNTQNVIYSRIHQKKQGPEPPANQNDMTENIPQEGEGPNNPNENQQQAPFHLFGMNAPTDQAKEEEVTQEKIKELLDKFAEEPKIDNLPIMPRPGLRVTTGPDWMWKQNGVEIGDGGTVVERSNADEKEGVDYEGWVRVKWDNDVEEDYRYGVDYEFDIQPLEVGMDGVKWPSGRARITKDNEWLDSDDDYLESLQKEFSNIMAKENLRRDTDEQRRNVGMDNISTSTMESSTVTNTYMASTTTMTTATSVSTATSGSMVTSGLTAASGSTATNGSTTTSVSTATSGSMVTSGLTAASGSTATNGSTTTSGSMTTSGSTATSGSMVTSGLTAASGSTATNGSTTTSGSTATNMSAAATEREVCYIWQYLDEDGEWKTYHLNIQKKVESTYLRRERSVVINTENGSERLIFGVMEQRNVNKNTVRPIRRIAADLETLQELQEMFAS